jgi:hypothetical protein
MPYKKIDLYLNYGKSNVKLLRNILLSTIIMHLINLIVVNEKIW